MNYKASNITPSGDCKLDPLFEYPDPHTTARSIVDTYSNKCGLSHRPSVVLAKELEHMISAAISGTVDALTGKSEAYRRVRERTLRSAIRKSALKEAQSKKKNSNATPVKITR